MKVHYVSIYIVLQQICKAIQNVGKSASNEECDCRQYMEFHFGLTQVPNVEPSSIEIDHNVQI
jgi:hypothetical protein